MKNYIAYDPDNNVIEYFETEAEAEKWLNVSFEECGNDGFSEDMETGGYYIAKIIKRSHFVETYNKKDFTDEEWTDEMGYSLDFDSIGNIKLKNIL